MVYYLKYRPQRIDDLDSESVRKVLSSVLSDADIPHAFLFTGPKGLGKTSSARIVAKVVNCTASKKERKGGFEPCGNCDSCISITRGSNLDILEIDAASNRGIDEIRELKEKIRLAPVSSKKKVYIIDEVHMLTAEAFNALLKTLEEPPDHAMFVLATTEVHKIPSTILSRCFHVGFKKASVSELVRSFERIASGEKIKIDKEALEFIASISEGSFRDGAKILNEFAVSGNNKITLEILEVRYKTKSANQSIDEFIINLRKKNVKKLLNIIKDVSDQGIDFKFFCQGIIEVLHRELLEIVEGDINQETGQQIDELQNLILHITYSINEIKHSVLPQIPLEMAVIEYCIQDDLVKQSNPAAQVNKNYDNQSQSGISMLRKNQSNLKKVTAMYGNSIKTEKKSDDSKNSNSGISLLHTLSGEITKEWLDLFWHNLIQEMKSHNHTIAGVLRGCRIEHIDKDSLIIETSFKFHKERLDEFKTREEIARISKLLTGREMKVEVQLRSK